MRDNKPVVCNTSIYVYQYGGKCFCDFDPQRLEFIITLYNDDIDKLSMRIDQRLAYNCTPELIFNRFEEQYIKTLDQRAQEFYEEFTRELVKHSLDRCINIRR